MEFIQQHKIGEHGLQAGGAILKEGETVERLYTLLEGWAFRFKTLADGRRQILNFLLPGDLVGLQARLFEEADHGIEALTDVRLCVFSRTHVWDAFRTAPNLAFEMTWLGAREERIVDGTLLSVGRRSALERMAWLLVHLYGRAEALGLVRDGALALPVTQIHLADALGLSAVHTNRTLQLLRRKGFLELAGGVLRNVNTSRLAALARCAETEPPQRPLF